MKKMFYILILVFYFNSNLFSEDYISMKFNNIALISNGSLDNELGYVKNSDIPFSPGIFDFCYYEEDSWLILDYHNDSLKKWSKSNGLSVLRKGLSGAKKIGYSNGFAYLYSSHSTEIILIDMNNKSEKSLDIVFDEPINLLYALNNYIIGEYASGELFGINVEKGIKVSVDDLKESLKGKIHISEDGSISIDNIIITQDNDNFIFYFDIDSEFEVYEDLIIFEDFIGYDLNGNYYWGNGKLFLIFNSEGELIKKIRSNLGISSDIPYKVDPLGNIYTFKCNSKGHKFYMLERIW